MNNEDQINHYANMFVNNRDPMTVLAKMFVTNNGQISLFTNRFDQLAFLLALNQITNFRKFIILKPVLLQSKVCPKKIWIAYYR